MPRGWAPSAMLAAYPGAFAVLGGVNVGVAGLGVCERKYAWMSGRAGRLVGFDPATMAMRNGPNWGSIGLAQETLVRADTPPRERPATARDRAQRRCDDGPFVCLTDPAGATQRPAGPGRPALSR